MKTLALYLARHPQSQAPQLLLAQLNDAAGDRPGALREYRAYLALGPDEENRAVVERRIVQLSAEPP